MEQNQSQNNITSSDGSAIPESQSITFPTTLKTDAPASSPSSAGTITSGAALRKKYIYSERDKYIEDTKTIPGPELMDVFRREAELSYPKDGDYIVRDGVAMYLGIG